MLLRLALLAFKPRPVKESENPCLESLNARLRHRRFIKLRPIDLPTMKLPEDNRPDYLVHRYTDVLDIPILEGGGGA